MDEAYTLPHMGRLVEAALARQGLTQPDLARLADISRQYAWGVTRKAVIPLPMLARISLAIGVNLVAEVAAALPLPDPVAERRAQELGGIAGALRGHADTLSQLYAPVSGKQGD